MREIKNTSFFTGKGDAPRQYPWMSSDESCDIVIAGGGIAGCAAAYELAKAGIDVVLVSKKPIGFSSTAVNNSALAFQNDLMLAKLAKTVGKDTAIRAYTLCGEALDELEELAKISEDFYFHRRGALLYVSDPEQTDDLHTEYLMRKHNGFDVEFIERQEAGEEYSFDLQAGILSKNGAGEVDGYLLCHTLTKAALGLGARIYENTAIDSVETEGEGIRAFTGNGRSIRAKRMVLAIGWRQEEYIRPLISKKTVFTLVTEPVKCFSGYESRALIRNASTNVSLRSTADGRILAWGLDGILPEKSSRLGRLLNADKIADRKYTELNSEAEKMLCGIPAAAPEYLFRGTYGVTRDGLPLVGVHPDYENIYFDLPAGANSILFAIVAGHILVDLCQNEECDNPFSPERPSL